MIDLVDNIVEKLQRHGFSKGDRLAILSENRTELYYFILACWKLKIVVAPVSTRYPDQKLNEALKSINCKVLFISNSLKRTVSDIIVYVLEEFVSCSNNETEPIIFEQLELDLDNNASILFTSGSSGQPKGVLHTIGNHYYSALGAFQNIPFTKDDRWLMSLPMYHISGFSLIMRSLICGGTIVFPQAGQSIADAVIENGITHLSLVPAQLRELIQIPQTLEILRQCKSVLLGGAMADLDLIQNTLNQGVMLSTTYGSTEAASQVTTSVTEQLRENLQVSGKMLHYRELKIDAKSEILLKGKTLFKGYVKGEGANLPLDEQGWFHTGDLGSLDNQGLLTVVGRKDRMFISGGENIHPEEIEKALINIDSVDRAYVVPVSDTTMGQRPVGFLEMNESAEIDPLYLTEQLQNQFEKFKVPITFLPWPELASDQIKPNDSALREIAQKAVTQKEDLQR